MHPRRPRSSEWGSSSSSSSSRNSSSSSSIYWLLPLLLCFNPLCSCSLEFRSLKAMVQHAEKSFRPELKRNQLERGMYNGDQHRLMRVLAMMYRGDPVKIVALGGSITSGSGVHDGSASYVVRLRQWSRSAWPQGNVQVVNGAFPGVNSEYFSICASAHVPPDVDLVIVELCSNDPAVQSGVVQSTRRAFERLVRKLLTYSHKPAVVLLNTYQPLNVLPEHRQYTYLMNAEGFYFDVASYYGLPMMSMKAVAHHLMQGGVTGYLVNYTQHQLPKNHPDVAKYFFWDLMHPGAANGHRLLFELVAFMIMKASHMLLGAAVGGPLPAELVAPDAEPLPPPLFLGNFEVQRESCFIGESLRHMALEMEGFSWVNEAKPGGKAKWGYTALEPGSFIKFNTSTMLMSDTEAARAAAANETVGMLLFYLRSYEHQGIAQVTCSGCSCQPSRLDGHHPGTTSLLEGHSFQVSQHAQCLVLVTVLQETRSGGHKVKLGALMVAEEKGARVSDPGQEKVEAIGGVMGAGGTFDAAGIWVQENKDERT